MKLEPLAAASLLTLALASCTDLSSQEVQTPSAPRYAALQGASTAAVPRATNPVTITVAVDTPGAKINPAMWGAFFEDINFGADGGLYAEMVKNRAFEFPEALMGWSKIMPSNARGEIAVLDAGGFNANQPHFLRITSTAGTPMGVSNEGFRGMGVKAGESYEFSAQLRTTGTAPGRVVVELVSSDGTVLASHRLAPVSGNWAKVNATLKSPVTDPKARLNLMVQGPATVDFDMVSLFPQKTWKNRPGGLRADMVQMLADLRPGFLRFPGGCIVEGSDLARRYQWKNTIGPVEDRKLLVNRWNYEFKHRPTPDYFQTFGLGFFEYFQLCEDIGAQPLPIINCGMACQFNSAELVPLDQCGPFIQDALDLIEFANGPATSTWGAKRAAMGHPEPFNMKMLGVGNEQWGPQYLERLKIFRDAIKAKYPDIQLVSDAGPSPEDERFAFLWPRLVEMKADIVDQHCYANPIWFLANATRYDAYDRNGPKVFFGEYGAQSDFICSPKNKNNWECAIAEAAYMTGLERNADVVRMASYAPLFANEEAWQWTPDLMWTNSLSIRATPNYYVQQAFATNRGDTVLPVTNNAPVADLLPAGRVGVGTWKSTGEFKDVLVIRSNSKEALLASDFAAGAPGWSSTADTWKVADGAYQQTSPTADADPIVSLAGDKGWTDYTLSLKARTTGGTDGLVFTVLDDGKGAWVQWRLGGWNNTGHALISHYAEQDQFLERVPGSLETGKWYDVKITVNGDRIDCYLDGKRVQSATVLHHKIPALFTSAARDDKTGETILKIVNPGNHPVDANIRLKGATNVASTAQVTTLTGQPGDENLFTNPDNVAPKKSTINNVRPEFRHTIAPRTFTVLRIGTR
jgi:alpha-L-arabinofuranosidase